MYLKIGSLSFGLVNTKIMQKFVAAPKVQINSPGIFSNSKNLVVLIVSLMSINKIIYSVIYIFYQYFIFDGIDSKFDEV